jgi:hypothetical protein
MRRSIGYLLALTVPLPNAVAVSVVLSGADTSAPFAISVPSASLPANIVLAALNETNATQIVILWLLNLQLVPANGATGSLRFQSAEPAPDSLFGPIPGPRTNLSSPNSHIMVGDANVVPFSGQPVGPDMSRNIVELNLIADADTNGSFELLMRAFDPEEPDITSYWFEVGFTEPALFVNSSPSAYPGYVLLGTIHVLPAGPVPGDYTGDGVVDDSDYNLWRATFGTTATPAGSGADGNRNSNIDAADYVVWRDITSAASAVQSLGLRVPEPQSHLAMVVGLACVIEILSRAQRRRLCLAGHCRAIYFLEPAKGHKVN